jgi:hypothetical protein
MKDKNKVLEEIGFVLSDLEKSDYKIIKCSEAQLLGLPMPYDVLELVSYRNSLREKIENLRLELAFAPDKINEESIVLPLENSDLFPQPQIGEEIKDT